MGKYELLDRLVEEGNGYLRTADVIEKGISKTTLAKYVQENSLERVAHGVYASDNAWPDDYYLLHLRNSKIVFSHESALFLHNLIDREPYVTTVTVPKNYNGVHIIKQGVHVIHVKPEWYTIGITKVTTGFGNEVLAYDRERSICDIIRARKETEIQTYQTALKEYMNNRGKNLGNLISYARELGIEAEVRTYTEVML